MKNDLGVECVVVKYDSSTNHAEFLNSYEFKLVKEEGSLLHFEMLESLSNPGIHQYAIRVYPKNVDLSHRMDFAYVRWIS